MKIEKNESLITLLDVGVKGDSVVDDEVSCVADDVCSVVWSASRISRGQKVQKHVTLSIFLPVWWDVAVECSVWVVVVEVVEDVISSVVIIEVVVMGTSEINQSPFTWVLWAQPVPFPNHILSEGILYFGTMKITESRFIKLTFDQIYDSSNDLFTKNAFRCMTFLNQKSTIHCMMFFANNLLFIFYKVRL